MPASFKPKVSSSRYLLAEVTACFKLLASPLGIVVLCRMPESKVGVDSITQYDRVDRSERE